MFFSLHYVEAAFPSCTKTSWRYAAILGSNDSACICFYHSGGTPVLNGIDMMPIIGPHLFSP